MTGTIYVTVHRGWTGDYWTEVRGDIDAVVAVSVTEYDEDAAHDDPEQGETVYQNDASIALWEDYHFNGGPNPNTLGEDAYDNEEA